MVLNQLEKCHGTSAKSRRFPVQDRGKERSRQHRHGEQDQGKAGKGSARAHRAQDHGSVPNDRAEGGNPAAVPQGRGEVEGCHQGTGKEGRTHSVR